MQIKSPVSLAVLASAAALLVSASTPAPAIDAGPLAPLFAPAQGDTRAAILIEDGRVVAKHYAAGYSDGNRFISWSMAKSITAMLVGELVADGKLTLDAPAPIAEWHKPGDPRGRITLRHLLNMASGLEHTEVGEQVENSDTNQVLFVGGTQNMAARAIAQPLEARPGERFEYSSLTTIILSEIVTRTLTDSRDPQTRAKAYREFEYARLFTPIGITSAFPEFDGAGTQVGGSLIHMTLDDYGRLGGLLHDGKAPDGTQVIAPDWLAFIKAPSPTNAEYGGQLWLNRPGGADGTPSLFPDKGPADLVSMNGHLGQYVMAFNRTGADGTAHRYVLVRLGNTRESSRRTVMGSIGDVVARLEQPRP